MLGLLPPSVWVDFARPLRNNPSAPQLFFEFSAQLGLQRRFTYSSPVLHALVNSCILQQVHQKALNFLPMLAQQTLYVQYTRSLLALVPRWHLPPILLYVVQPELQQTQQGHRDKQGLRRPLDGVLGPRA